FLHRPRRRGCGAVGGLCAAVRAGDRTRNRHGLRQPGPGGAEGRQADHLRRGAGAAGRAGGRGGGGLGAAATAGGRTGGGGGGGPAAPGRVLAIGDGPDTDLLGAERQGFDALFVADGIHRADVLDGGALRPEGVDALLREKGRKAAWAMAALAW